MKNINRVGALIVGVALLINPMPLAAGSKKVRAQIEAIPVGSMVEIQFSSGDKATGKLESLEEDRVVVQVEKADSVRMIAYMIRDIAEVRPALPPAKSLEVTPDSLYAAIKDEHVDLMTREGIYVRGKVVGADAETIWLEVKKCEPKGRYAGRASIRTEDISVVHMKKGGSVAGSILLGAAGGFGGLLAGSAIWYASRGAGGPVFPITGLVGGIAGGAYAGHVLSKKKVTISVSR